MIHSFASPFPPPLLGLIRIYWHYSVWLTSLSSMVEFIIKKPLRVFFSVLYPPASHHFNFLCNTTELFLSLSSFCSYLSSWGWGPERSWHFNPLRALGQFWQGSPGKDLYAENTEVRNGRKQLRGAYDGGEAIWLYSLIEWIYSAVRATPRPFLLWAGSAEEGVGSQDRLFGRTKQTNHRHPHPDHQQ